MKLIDIEAINWYDDLFLKGVNHSGVWVRYRDVEKLIRNAPIVDPERHARWQEPEGGDGPGERLVTFRCSACGASDLHANGMIVPYCWHCGAKMNGGENDG